MIGDILAKQAHGEKLTEFEIQQLRLWGNRSELDSQYVASIQDGTGTLKTKRLEAEFAVIKSLATSTDSQTERTATLTATQSMPNNSYSGMYGYTAVVNDNYTFNGSGQIFVPEGGVYSVSGFYVFSDSGSSSGTRSGHVLIDSGYTSVFTQKTPVSGTDTTFTISGDLNVAYGDSFRFIVYQNSGGAMNVSVRVIVRKKPR